MQDWEIWSTYGGEKDGITRSYPCLYEVSIINCPKLDVVEIESIPSVRVLHIQGCSVAVLRSMVGLSSSILSLTMENIKGLSQLDGDVLKNLGVVEHLWFRSCHDLRYLWESELEACQILVSLWDLRVEFCQNLVSSVQKEASLGISLKSLRHVYIDNCPSLESYNCPNSIEKLVIDHCPLVTSLTFPPVHDPTSTMKILDINSSHNLKMSWLLNNFLSSLGSLCINNVSNVRSFPENCLLHLTSLIVSNCGDIESIPENGFGFLPFFGLRSLHIHNCKNLKSFPHEHLQSLSSLEKLWIRDCPIMDYSFPCGLWPPNLSFLSIGNLIKPMAKWGLQNFPTSLVELCIVGKNSGVVSFATVEDMRTNSNITTTPLSLFLPPSLTYSRINGFTELESLSKGLQHLTCLEKLATLLCPKLRDLPEPLLPLLSFLLVKSCPKLEKRCSKKGNYWHIISQIPHLDID